MGFAWIPPAAECGEAAACSIAVRAGARFGFSCVCSSRNSNTICRSTSRWAATRLGGVWGFRRAHPQELAVTAPKRTARECSAVKRYIDANFRQPISLDHLAEVSQLNKYYLAHAFREYIGLSPINYLNSRRVEEARVLLRDTSHSISEIAGIVGFSSQSYFAQVFQKAVGESPGEYRKRLRRGRQEKQE